MSEKTEPKTLLQEIQTWPAHARANLFGELAEQLTVEDIINQLRKAKLSQEVEDIKAKL